MFFKRVGDVLQKDEAQHDVLVFRRVHAAAQGVGHFPQVGLIAVYGFALLFRAFLRHAIFLQSILVEKLFPGSCSKT